MDLIRDVRNGFASYAASRLRNEYFTYIDVGCSGGIDSAWRVFGERLRAVGFDPNIQEVARLREAETFPHVRYEAAFVDLPQDHPVRVRRGAKDYWGRNPWDRLAVARTIQIRSAEIAAATNEEKTAMNAWGSTSLSEDRHVHLPEYFRASNLADIDFIKIDIDSCDFDVLQGLGDDLGGRRVLGMGLEVNFFGSDDPGEHTFHNTDRLMKKHGFELFGLSVRTYSAAALPFRYQEGFPAQSVGGRPLQGDALYVRDLCNPEWRSLAKQYSVEKLLKLAVVYSVGGLTDCAAEVLTGFRSELSAVMDIDLALDMLTRESDPARAGLRYNQLIEEFERNSPSIYSK